MNWEWTLVIATGLICVTSLINRYFEYCFEPERLKRQSEVWKAEADRLRAINDLERQRKLKGKETEEER